MRYICSMRLIIVFILFSITLANCRKADRNEDTDMTMGYDVADAECVLYELFSIANESCLSTPGIRSYISCATLTSDTLGTPRVLTIDFGAACVGTNGRTRSGKMIIYQTGFYSTTGSSGIVYFNDFYLNGYNVDGNFSITKTTSGYRIYASSLSFMAPDSSYHIRINGTQTFIQTSGNATFIADDDTFSVTGIFSVTGKRGGQFTCTIDNANPIFFNGICGEPVSGKLTIAPAGLVERPLDFGSGTCDGQFLLYLNGEANNLNISF